MTLDYSEPGNVKIDMQEYIERLIKEFPILIEGSAATPASEFLFKVNDAAALLDEKQAEQFHTNVAKLLFLCQRARPDIQVAVAFLTT